MLQRHLPFFLLCCADSWHNETFACLEYLACRQFIPTPEEFGRRRTISSILEEPQLEAGTGQTDAGPAQAC